MRSFLLSTAWLALATLSFSTAHAAKPGVQVTPDSAHRRVQVTIDGQPFTAYVWPDTLKKPTLYPIFAPGEIEVTRGYPLVPREGERTDHPHHAGMWFNYGNVNGFDFWNNSDAIKPADRGKMGTIHHTRIVSASSGRNSGDLVVDSVWTDGAGQDIIQQRTHYVFSRHQDSAGKEVRVIDQTYTLHALQPLVFNDDKEGMLGLRVAHFLESADEKGGTFTDASGRPTSVQASNVPGATGVYLTSEGVKGAAVWSTRGRWCLLTGTDAQGQTVTIAMIDNPKNENYPTFWHARGYGLFAANPLGQHIFDPKLPSLAYKVDAGNSATFRYRVLLQEGAPTPAQVDREADDFARSPTAW